MIINYVYADPTGNITALVTTPVPADKRAMVGSCIMKEDPTIEQVGFIDLLPDTGENAPGCLYMAGGEFCGNATISAAALMVSGLLQTPRLMINGCDRLPVLSPGSETDIFINSSGAASNPMKVHISNASSYSECATSLYTGKLDLLKNTKMPEIKYSGDTATVYLSGITHMIVPEGTCSNEAALAEVKKQQELLNAEAMGLLQISDLSINKETNIINVSMRPLVYVPGSDSLIWERGCASGSAAVALYLTDRLRKSSPSGNKENTTTVKVSQPGGVIDVCVTYSEDLYGKNACSVSISGHVRFVSAKECLCPGVV